ncbi:MAG TPA: IS1595 family transposase [Alphaproteobacteria bacterium]|nr:IS1595 family transposase [Alphaproteobacteria bacterium]
MASNLSAPHFHNETLAYAHVEALLWPDGPVCPHCGNADAARIGRLEGKSTRAGLRKCYACREQFTVKVGTIFEDSHAPLRIWLQAIHLMCSSKKGISTRQLQRTLGVGMKTAWFMGHRIRTAMAPAKTGPVGGSGKTVEADETWITKSPKTRRKPHERTDTQILSLVERGGPIRSMFLDHRTVRSALYRHLDPKSRLVTDKAQAYKFFVEPGNHESVDHSKGEYVRGDVHTNTLEGFFSIFKRGLIGVYQHIDEKHLDRYLAEFDFRQNNRAKLGIDDVERAEIALKGIKGKRLTYRTTDRAEAQA